MSYFIKTIFNHIIFYNHFYIAFLDKQKSHYQLMIFNLFVDILIFFFFFFYGTAIKMQFGTIITTAKLFYV
jgi:hypothetical protein